MQKIELKKVVLGLHIKDLPLLFKIQQSLGGIGSIHTTPAENKVNYSIDSKQDLLQLIDHLDKYPLLTQKKADFLLFKEVVELMSNKSHLTMEGLQQISAAAYNYADQWIQRKLYPLVGKIVLKDWLA